MYLMYDSSQYLLQQIPFSPLHKRNARLRYCHNIFKNNFMRTVEYGWRRVFYLYYYAKIQHTLNFDLPMRLLVFGCMIGCVSYSTTKFYLSSINSHSQKYMYFEHIIYEFIWKLAVFQCLFNNWFKVFVCFSFIHFNLLICK